MIHINEQTNLPEGWQKVLEEWKSLNGCSDKPQDFIFPADHLAQDEEDGDGGQPH